MVHPGGMMMQKQKTENSTSFFVPLQLCSVASSLVLSSRIRSRNVKNTVIYKLYIMHTAYPSPPPPAFLLYSTAVLFASIPKKLEVHTWADFWRCWCCHIKYKQRVYCVHLPGNRAYPYPKILVAQRLRLVFRSSGPSQRLRLVFKSSGPFGSGRSRREVSLSLGTLPSFVLIFERPIKDQRS